MVLGEKHGTNYLPCTFFECYFVLFMLFYIRSCLLELGRTFRGAFRPSLIGRIFFRMSATKSDGCILSLKLNNPG